MKNGNPAAHAVKYCRACGGRLRGGALLRYAGMPCGAQNFPAPEKLSSDGSLELELVECPCCGVAQLTNKPVSYWREVIRAVGFSAEMLNFRRGQLEDFVRRRRLEGRHGIEVGCGDGAYLEVLARTGLAAHGLEHSARNVRACERKGLDVRRGFARKGVALDGNPFDAFFVFSYLEHVPDLRDFLATIRANVRSGAVGLIEVPNFDMILRKKLFAEFIVDHLFYFTAETLTRTLENNGFRVLSCAPVWHEYILSAEAEARPSLDVSALREEWRNVAVRFRNFLRNHGRAAVWGAGHQAFTMLAMLGDTGKIAYIVDSALFKQGRYSPVTHIEVAAPRRLLAEPVDALIIMAGSYSDEIADIAWKEYGQKNIAVFRDNALVPYAAAGR